VFRSLIVFLLTLAICLGACGHPSRQPSTVRTNQARGPTPAPDVDAAAFVAEVLGPARPPAPDPPPAPCADDLKERFRRWFRHNLHLLIRLYRCDDLQQIKVWTTLRLETDEVGVIRAAPLTSRGASAPLPSRCPQEIYVGRQIRCFDGAGAQRVHYPIHPCFGLGPDDVCR